MATSSKPSAMWRASSICGESSRNPDTQALIVRRASSDRPERLYARTRSRVHRTASHSSHKGASSPFAAVVEGRTHEFESVGHKRRNGRVARQRGNRVVGIHEPIGIDVGERETEVRGGPQAVVGVALDELEPRCGARACGASHVGHAGNGRAFENPCLGLGGEEGCRVHAAAGRGARERTPRR